jgi:hypothetical protein
MSRDPLEAGLRRLYEVSIPVHVAAALDRRTEAAVAKAMAVAGPRPAKALAVARPRPKRAGGLRLMRRRRLLLVLAAVVVLVTVAAAPVLRFFEGWGQPFDRVLELSTVIDQSVTDDGYRVTVMRAYGDPSGVRMTISVEDLDDRGWSQIGVGDAHVRDGAGRAYPLDTGMSDERSAESSASWLRFRVPPDAPAEPERHMFVDIDRIDVRLDPVPTLANGELDFDHVWSSVAGTWSFEFDLPFQAAETANPDSTATANGITVTLEELSVTPAVTVGRLTFDGLPEVEPGWPWYPMMRIEHDGEPVSPSTLDPGFVADQLMFEADPGFEDLSGTWVITIDAFHRDVADPSGDVTHADSIEGPWVLTFEGPEAPGPS